MLRVSSGCTSLTAGDVLDADHPLVHRLVRQPRRPDDVADRIDPRLAGAQPFVDHDMAALDLHAGAVEAQLLDIADDADRQDHPLGRHRERLAVGFDLRCHIVRGRASAPSR